MRADPTADVSFEFGPFKLLPRQQVLLRDGRPVKLGGRALDILHLLVMRAGEQVGKSALIEFAWPNVFVDDSNLKVHISSLRRALEDTLPQATYIATVAGRGYQFVGSVRTERGEPTEVDLRPAASSFPAASLLIGRQRDIEAGVSALERTGLVTLTGPGGVGKTSLAIAVAQARRHELPDGVHFVDLSVTDDAALVPSLLAASLGVRGPSADLLSAVVDHLQDRRALVVLDNCEHLLHATATIAARLLEAKVKSCLLATSREPLGIAGEMLQRVEPLAFPRGPDPLSASESLTYPSIELFALRAFESADYRLVDRDTHAVARLCEALDGLPLALEIAAAKLDELTPAELLDSVGRRLGELGKEDGTEPSRHRTLWATLDWSYQLLSPLESSLLRLLSVFAGSFEWSDVVSMAKLALFDPYQTTSALGGLVSKSMLTAELDGEQLRYRLLQSTRSYAAARLLDDPLAFAAERHHARLLLSVLERSEAEWGWVDNRVWRARYEVRVGDLRTALDWCFTDEGDTALGVELTIAAIRLWNEQSFICEQRSRVERALEHCASMADEPRLAAALATSRAWGLTMDRQLHAETDDAWETALTLAERSHDVVRHLSVMLGHATFLVYTGRNEQAVAVIDTLKRIAEQHGDRASLIDGERLAALAEMHLGKLVSVQTTLSRLALELASGMPPSRIGRYQEQRYVGIHSILAISTWLTGQPEQALAMIEEMVAKTEQVRQLMGQSHVLALFALPLTLLSGQMDALERYSTLLRRNLDSEHIALWEPVQRFYAAFSRHARGDASATGDMRSAIDQLIRDRFLVRTPLYLGTLADAHLSNGRNAEASEAVESALALQAQSNETWCLPELLRVKAKIVATVGHADQARAILGRAREAAASIGARSLELRIAHDLLEMAVSEPVQMPRTAARRS